MLIGLDARTIFSPTRRGTAKNLIDLYRHVLAMREDWQCVGYHRRPDPDAANPIGQGFRTRRIEILGDRVDAWQRWRLPMAAWRDGVDLLHCPANTCPSWMPTRTLVTIHDLIPLDLPQGRPAAHIRRFAESIRTACATAAGIICPSQYTADRLVTEFDAHPDFVTVIPWAPDSSVSYVPEDQRLPVLEQYGITKPFVLHFGAAAPRKNTRRLIASWAMLDERVRNHWQLVVVGLDRQTYRRMVVQAESLGIHDQVLLNGFADEQDVPALLSAADALAYPSYAEGFGLPVLDAWATQTPVLASDSSSIPEIVGDAGQLVDPTDAVSIAQGLEALMTSESRRAELVKLGSERVTDYTWQRTAGAFVEFTERITQHRGTPELTAA